MPPGVAGAWALTSDPNLYGPTAETHVARAAGSHGHELHWRLLLPRRPASKTDGGGAGSSATSGRRRQRGGAEVERGTSLGFSTSCPGWVRSNSIRSSKKRAARVLVQDWRRLREGLSSRKPVLLHPAPHTRLVLQVLLSEGAFQITFLALD
jgi:hypothetical protein